MNTGGYFDYPDSEPVEDGDLAGNRDLAGGSGPIGGSGSAGGNGPVGGSGSGRGSGSEGDSDPALDGLAWDGGPGMGFLAATDDADWAVLFAHGQTRRYPAGAQVVGAGEADRALYLVLEGELTTQGRQIENHYPGAILGERGFLEGRPFGAAVLAVTGCEVFRLGLAEFEVLAAKDPALGRYLLFDLARVLAAQADRLRADQLRLDWLRADR